MAHLIRGKQSGVQKDLSAGLAPDLFAFDILHKYGVNSQIRALAYDPVQSLLAIGTKETQWGSGRVYVFGRRRIQVTFLPSRPASILDLKFSADKLIAFDSKNDISVYDLSARKVIASFSPPSRVTSMCVDPTLDYALVGLQNGDLVAYDIDRQGQAPFKIPYLWSEFNPRCRPSPVIALALHPRDVGTLLVGYPEGIAVYSFKQAKPTSFLLYELSPGAPGGQPEAGGPGGNRYPRLAHMTWHPTGTFILAAYEDESLVIWDPKTSKIIQARTLQSVNVNQPGAPRRSAGTAPGTIAVNAPIFKLAWCAKQNPDDTGILIAGGMPMNLPDRGLTFMELGPTPMYATSSWQVLSEHFEKPKRQHVLPTPPGLDVVDFCLIPRASPHFAGAHDPIAVLAVLSSGEMVTMSFPSGHHISCTNQLHPTMSFVQPFVDNIAVASLERTRWLGMSEKRDQGPEILKGGAGGKYPMRRFEGRNIISTAHADGTVRVWDAGHGDEIENQEMMQADVARALCRNEQVDVAKMSLSGASGELAVGMRSGEIVVFRYGENKNYGQPRRHQQNEALGLEDIRDTADPSLKKGLLPLTMLAQHHAPVTALRMSDVGFVAAGFHDGSIAVMDLRGPALIYQGQVNELIKGVKRGSMLRRTASVSGKPQGDHATVVNFGVMNLEDEAYSSIQCFVGTKNGHVITLKILPGRGGAYEVQPAGATAVEGNVVSLTPLDAVRGLPANANPQAVAGLQEGRQVDGVVLAVSSQGIRLFKPPLAKGASKSFDGVYCDSAGISRDVETGGIGLIGLFGDGTVKTFAIPSLKDLSSQRIDKLADVRRFSDAIVTSTADLFLWMGPSEIVVVNPWGAGQDLSLSLDLLYNPELLIPPRPTISNVQWLSGTQYVTPADLDLLIGGPNRPPSQRMLAQMRADEQQKREAERAGQQAAAKGGKEEEGYWAYMQRSMQERTQRMNLVGDSMDKLEESSTSFANDVSKFVSQQKKKAVMGVIGSKFGF